MIDCRKATVADAGSIVALRAVIWNETYRGIYPQEMLENYDLDASQARFAQRLADPAHAMWLFLDDGEAIGYFAIGPSNFGPYKDFDLCLNNLYIRREYKGMGLGRRAFEIVRSECTARGIHRFFCGCNYHNIHAMGFYRHMGGIQGDQPVFHDNKADDIVHFEFTTGV